MIDERVIESRREDASHDPDRHLSTDHLLEDLKGRTVSSAFVTASVQGVKLLLNVASIMVMARLLAPEDFGLVGMVMVVLGFVRVFKDVGLSTATIQMEGITHAQVSNLFWVNLIIGALMSLVIASSAPLLAWFFHEDRLIAITIWLSLTFLLSGSTIQHQALLDRQMRFKAKACIEIGSLVVGYASGIAIALWGYGYWSLVGSTLILESTGLLLTWFVSRWRPQRLRRRSGTGPLLKFGVDLTIGGLLYSLARGTDTVLIGRFYGPDAVGLYSRASSLQMRPIEQFLSPMSAVVVPALSRLQGQADRYRRAFLHVNEAIALAGFPLAAVFLALAHPITLVLLGPKWEAAAAILAGFTIAAVYAPLAAASTWLFATQGRSSDLLIANTILSILTIVAFVGGLPFGPVGIACSFSVTGLLIRLPVLYYIAGRRGPVTTRDLWATFARHLPVYGVVLGTTVLLRVVLDGLPPAQQLVVCASGGLLVGGLFVMVSRPHRRTAVGCLRVAMRLRATGASV